MFNVFQWEYVCPCRNYSSRHYYAAYHVRRSAKRCHLRMKIKELHCGLFSGKVTNAATPSILIRILT